MPIVTRDLLHGGAQTYGVMLGTIGMGAVIGALNISTLRGRLGDERSAAGRGAGANVIGVEPRASRRRFDTVTTQLESSGATRRASRLCSSCPTRRRRASADVTKSCASSEDLLQVSIERRQPRIHMAVDAPLKLFVEHGVR